MGKSNIFSGDNHDVETWLDFFTKKHLTGNVDNYTVTHYWEHFHPVTDDIEFPPDNFLFIKDMKIFSLDETVPSSMIFENEDSDTWQFISPAIAVRTTGAIIYSTYDIIDNTVIKSISNININIQFLQIYGYLITVRP